MAKAKKLPSGSWRVQLYAGTENGKRAYKSFTAATKKEAEYMAAEYRVTKKEKSRTAVTIGDAMTAFIDSKTNVFSPATIDGYRSIRRNAFKGIMNVKMSDITDNMLQNAVNQEAARLSPKTVISRYTLLASVLHKYRPDYKPDVNLPKKVKREMHIPVQDELTRILSAVAGSDIELPVMLAVCMGLRRSEICALTWPDYNESNQTIIINKAMVLNESNLYVIKPPKTFAGSRRLSVPDPVVSVLGRLPRTGETIVGMNPNMLSHKYDRVVRSLGIQINFHALRHYYASMLMSLGIPDKYAMERMGHATPDMLKKVYQHTMLEKQKSIDQAINQALLSRISHEISHKPPKTQ